MNAADRVEMLREMKRGERGPDDYGCPEEICKGSFGLKPYTLGSLLPDGDTV